MRVRKEDRVDDVAFDDDEVILDEYLTARETPADSEKESLNEGGTVSKDHLLAVQSKEIANDLDKIPAMDGKKKYPNSNPNQTSERETTCTTSDERGRDHSRSTILYYKSLYPAPRTGIQETPLL